MLAVSRFIASASFFIWAIFRRSALLCSPQAAGTEREGAAWECKELEYRDGVRSVVVMDGRTMVVLDRNSSTDERQAPPPALWEPHSAHEEVEEKEEDDEEEAEEDTPREGDNG